MANIVALKLSSQLSPLLYANFVLIAVAIPIFVMFTVPLAVEAYEETGKLLKRKYLAYKSVRRVRPSLARTVLALRPLTIYAGLLDHRLFNLQRPTLRLYGRVYIDNTIFALMYISV